MYFFFNDTATTEIYTYCHTFPTRRSSDLGRSPASSTPTRRSAEPSSTTISDRDGARLTTRSTAQAMPLPASSISRSEEHTSELQSLTRISYAVFCLKKKNNTHNKTNKVDKQTKYHN